MAERSRTSGSRWSRSSSACNGCRARKQKCGGEKPRCARCRALSQRCVWPQQQKRGPTKGYVEALESRLLETEHILHKLISSLSPEDLFFSLRSSSSSDFGMQDQYQESSTIPGVPVIGNALSSAEKRALIQHWAEYPLDTPSHVHLWHSIHWNRPATNIGGSTQAQISDEDETLRKWHGEDNAMNEFARQRHGPVRNIGRLEGGIFRDAEGFPNDRDLHSTGASAEDTQRPMEIQANMVEEGHRGLNIPSEFQDMFLW